VVAAAATIGYATHYAQRTLPNTSVASIDVSGQSPDQLRSTLTDAADAATLTMTLGDTTRTATLSDLGYSVNVDATVTQIMSPNASVIDRLKALNHKLTVTPTVTHDATTLGDYAASLTASYGADPVNATVGLSADGTTFAVTPDQPGKGVDADALASAANDVATTLKPGDITIGVVDMPAPVTAAMLQPVADKANAMVQTSITVDEGDGTGPHTPTAADIASWITLTPDADGLPVPQVDQTKIEAWLQPIADSLATKPAGGQRNVDPNGNVVSIMQKAVDGRTVNNVTQLSSDIADALNTATAYTGTFTYDTVPGPYTDTLVAAPGQLAYNAAPDEKWLDVNMTTYTVTAYIGGTSVWSTHTIAIVKPATPTVTGTYQIYLKYDTMTMNPTNADGTPAPPVPNVQWVSFWYKGYAFHAAWWLSASQYGSPQSHGCINMTNADAKWIYDWAPIGTTVVSHK
jgi:lipoprotein-anchoring transpeptidase ErfK/SrfK